MSKFRSQQLVVSALLSLALLSACGKSPEQARRELGELDIPYTPSGLQQAVENKDSVAIDLFMKSGFDVSPALPIAIRQGDRELIKKLLDNKADVNYQNGVPLHNAVVNNDPETAKLLLSRGANPNLKVDRFGFGAESPLEEAAAQGRTELVRLLLDNGASINDEEGSSNALLDAITRERVEIVQLLLESGANPNSEKVMPSSFSLSGTYKLKAFNLASDNPQILALLKQYSKTTPLAETEMKETNR